MQQFSLQRAQHHYQPHTFLPTSIIPVPLQHTSVKPEHGPLIYKTLNSRIQWQHILPALLLSAYLQPVDLKTKILMFLLHLCPLLMSFFNPTYNRQASGTFLVNGDMKTGHYELRSKSVQYN
ncbi:hypothetical protein E2C01_001558 [Portunus trituberculatus]|uniref:Uncharacterized protein n=1 Tax=Portunus trituberculatus TaxID=210409 RepID=A0A5B7CHL3_PORTR|nr:hypothetical protein [Portunus trituberculatus]